MTLAATRVAVERIASRGDEELWAELIPFAGRSKRTLELAAREARSLGHTRIGAEHILLGLLRDEEGIGARVLAAFDIDYQRTRDAVVVALASESPRKLGRLGRRDAQYVLALVAVFAVGVLVGRAVSKR
jgi:ATP-dependent Clp protease ATP-binding subunit ClpC